jgi:hypothetical protein
VLNPLIAFNAGRGAMSGRLSTHCVSASFMKRLDMVFLALLLGAFAGAQNGITLKVLIPTLRRRSQKRRISGTRILELAQRWIRQPRALHRFPDARFAATHPR